MIGLHMSLTALASVFTIVTWHHRQQTVAAGAALPVIAELQLFRLAASMLLHELPAELTHLAIMDILQFCAWHVW